MAFGFGVPSLLRGELVQQPRREPRRRAVQVAAVGGSSEGVQMLGPAAVGASLAAATRVRWAAAAGASFAATRAFFRRKRETASPDLFLRDLNGLQAAATMRCACRFNIFSKVGALQRRGSHATAGAVAAACGCSERGMGALLECLCSYGHLRKRRVPGDGGRGGRVTAFELTPASARFLDEASPAYMGAVADWMTSETYHDGLWNDMMGSVHKGGAVRGGPQASDGRWLLFARAFGPLAGRTARRLAAHAAPLLRRRPQSRVLDVGASHGAFGIEMARMCEGVSVTALDWPNVLELTRANAKAAGLLAAANGGGSANGGSGGDAGGADGGAAVAAGPRWEAMPGDALTIGNLGGPYDVILLPNVLHLWSRAENAALLRRCRKALRPGGAVYIVDRMNGATADAPFTMLMLAFTAGGRTYGRSEYEDMLRRAGFGRISRVDRMPAGAPVQALVAYNEPRRGGAMAAAAAASQRRRGGVAPGPASTAARTGGSAGAGAGAGSGSGAGVGVGSAGSAVSAVEAAATAGPDGEDRASSEKDKPLEYPMKLGDFFTVVQDVLLGFRPIEPPVDWK